MGFVKASFSPGDASRIVGDGYGGSIHFWTRANNQPEPERDGAGVDDDADDTGGRVFSLHIHHGRQRRQLQFL